MFTYPSACLDQAEQEAMLYCQKQSGKINEINDLVTTSLAYFMDGTACYGLSVSLNKKNADQRPAFFYIERDYT